jgi:hypothetical protein
MNNLQQQSQILYKDTGGILNGPVLKGHKLIFFSQPPAKGLIIPDFIPVRLIVRYLYIRH